MSKESQLFSNTSVRYSSDSRLSEGSGRLIMVAIFIALVAFVAFILPGIVVPEMRTMQVNYPHGIVAVIEYNALQGFPRVDSTFTFAQIIRDTCVNSVTFDLGNGDSAALVYLAFTIYQFSPTQGEKWIRENSKILDAPDTI